MLCCIISPIRCLRLEQRRFFFLIDLDFCCALLCCCREIIKRSLYRCRGGAVSWRGRTRVLPFFIHPRLTLRQNVVQIKPGSWAGGVGGGTCPGRARCSVRGGMRCPQPSGCSYPLALPPPFSQLCAFHLRPPQRPLLFLLLILV